MNNQPFTVTVSDVSYFPLPSNIKKILLLLEESTFFEHLAIIDYLILQKIEIQIYIKAEQIPKEIKRYVQDKLPKHQRTYPLFPWLMFRQF